MLQATSTFTRKHYAFLGKLFIEKEPEIAEKLISKYLPQTEPLEKDCKRIPEFFIVFCKIHGINPGDFVGPLYKSRKVDVRRQFIAVVLHLYVPQVFSQPADDLILDRNLSKNLSNLFQISKGNISDYIREVVTWYKQYEDFSSGVIEIIEKIKTAG